MIFDHLQRVLLLLIYRWKLSNTDIFITLIHDRFHIIIMNKKFRELAICVIAIQLAIISCPINTC